MKLWLTFDLKGATANRRTLAARDLHQTAVGEVAASGSGSCRCSGSASASSAPSGGGHPSHGTLKDWEWMDIAMAIDVSDDDKRRIADAVVSDANFLASQARPIPSSRPRAPRRMRCRGPTPTASRV